VIEAAQPEDFPEILAIYNEVIRNSTAVYTEVEYDDERGRAWFQAKIASGHPFIVARDAAGVAGFGAFGDFRPWQCYRNTVEHSVHVRADCRGQGHGRALVLELMDRAAKLNKHVMVGVVDADNAASIGLHRSLGFQDVGRFREVGFKFGRWLDLLFLQCILSPTVAHGKNRDCNTETDLQP
jgi:L-amino acid N-acyltransferase YncA